MTDPVSQIGKMLIGLGIFLVILGLCFVFRNYLPGFLKHLGRLPGDIAYEKNGVGFYFPVVTSIIISVLLTLLFWIFRR